MRSLTTGVLVWIVAGLGFAEISVHQVSDEHRRAGARYAIDNNPRTYWHTGRDGVSFPHTLDLDLGESRTVHGFSYLPKPRGADGRVRRYRVAVSSDAKEWRGMADGSFDEGANAKIVRFKSPVEARYLRFEALSDLLGSSYAGVAEFHPILDPDNPPLEELSKFNPQRARSVHLGYQSGAADAFYNEATITESHPGSFFMAAGFGMGYFGVQQLGDANDKIALFSVWDNSPGHDPNAVGEDRRVKVLAQGDGVYVGRFGGEGTGGQCKMKLNWKTGQTLRFYVSAARDGDWTTFTGYISEGTGPDAEWKLMASFQTYTRGKRLEGLHSFVEDFRRTSESYTWRRQANFGPAFALRDGEWRRLDAAKFTADGYPVENIDAGTAGPGFFLATGGDAAMSNLLWKVIRNEEAPANKAPLNLPDPN